METLLVSLILATVSAITFIAYKHPHAYARLYWPIFAITTIAWGMVFSWNMAISSAERKIQTLVPPPGINYTPAVDAISNMQFGGIWIGAIYMAITIYLSFLLWLPNILSDDEKKKYPNDPRHNEIS